LKSQAKLALKVVFSLALLVWLVWQSGIENTLRELSRANLWYVPFGVLIYLLSQLVSAYRWQFLSAPLGFVLALREFYDYYLMGMFFNLFLPGAIGGDVSRMLYLAKSCGKRKREAVLTLLAERGVGLVALLLLTCVLCLLPVTAPMPTGVRPTILAMGTVMVVGFIGLHLVPLERLAERFSRLAVLAQAKVYWNDTPMLLKSIGLSVLVHACMVAIHLLIATALGIQIPIFYLAATFGVVSLVSVLPVAFNGIGLREGAYVMLLTRVGVPDHTALAFALYWFLISTCTSLVGGLVMLKGHYQTPKLQEVEA
jgi:uncharacterized membrane protein YbhN (UPF0104 family)